MSSNKRMSIQSKFSFKFPKSKTDLLSRTDSGSSGVSDTSTVVAIPIVKKGIKIEICEEDLLDWDDRAWGTPQSIFSWSDLFGRNKD